MTAAPAGPPRPNTVTLTIDGAEVTVPAGTLVVEAARLAGVEVPVFCYHPKLSLAGACRMCQCSIAMAPPPGQPARPPALMTACTTRVTPGMVVDTMSAPAVKARESVIEFLLINHPLDCPVCDAGGECPLQDNSHAWGPKESRFAEDKRLARKGASLSPLVVLDQERCIVCYRCTRFMAEIPGQAELDFHQRGYRSQLRVIEDRPMQSRFQGNIIDLCPCGALTSDTYRFRSRPHDLDHSDSVCAQCPVGCNLILDSRANVMARVRPRQNEAVNEIWLCDKGRFGHHYASSPDRLRAPIVRQAGGAARLASWPEAIGSAAVALRRVKEQHGAQAIGVIGGRNLTNEDCYALARFAAEVLETPNVDHRIGARTRTANPLAAHGLDAFNSQYADAEAADAIVLLGTDVYEEMPVFWLRIRKGVTKGAKLLVANPRASEADRLAFRRLRYLPGQELAVLRALAAALVENPPMVEQPAPPPPAEGQEAPPAPPRVPRDLSALSAAIGGITTDDAARAAGLNVDAVRAAAEALAGAKRPLIYAGSRLAIRSDADQLAAALVALADALGSRSAVNYFAEGANARGAEYAGLVPGENGLSAGEIIAAAAEGQIKALYLVGENVLETHPDRQQAERALANAEVVVVHELFETATTQHAHVVFAATAVPEKDGTLTNAEGRLQRVYRGVIPPEQALPDWRILAELSAEMGATLGYAAPVEITRDLLADLPVYAAAAENIPAEGIICRAAPPLSPSLSPTGGEREVPGGAMEPGSAAAPGPSVGAAGSPLPPGGTGAPEARGRSPEVGGEGTLALLTYSELVGDETMVRPTAELMDTVPAPYVEVNAADAERLGLVNGQLATLNTARGYVERSVRINRRCPEGVCFTPDNLGRPRVNAILDWHTEQPRVALAPAAAAVAVADTGGSGASGGSGGSGGANLTHDTAESAGPAGSRA